MYYNIRDFNIYKDIVKKFVQFAHSLNQKEENKELNVVKNCKEQTLAEANLNYHNPDIEMVCMNNTTTIGEEFQSIMIFIGWCLWRRYRRRY